MKCGDKEYEFYSWTILEFPGDCIEYYKDIPQQMIENSEYYTPKNGYYYDSVYKELESFLSKEPYFKSIHFPEYIFIVSRFIRGTFILKEKNNE